VILTSDDWKKNIEELESLFEQSFNRKIQHGYLDWRYSKRGKDIFFSIESRQEKVVSSYSVFPIDIAVDNDIYASAISMTTMTHFDWRGKGFFQKLATEMYAYLKDKNFVAVWGFPNSNSHLAFKNKLSWSDIYEIPTLVLSLTDANYQLFALNDYIQTDNNFSLNYPKNPRDGFLRVNRTKDYLVWRYLENPVNEYQNYVLAHNGEVTSYVVTKLYQGGLDLVDIQCFDLNEAYTLFIHIIKLSINRKLSQLSCWASIHHGVHGVLERLGFKNSSPITYFGGLLLSKTDLNFDFYDYRNWYIQMGDSDIY
jgi:hypothetical protein